MIKETLELFVAIGGLFIVLFELLVIIIFILVNYIWGNGK